MNTDELKSAVAALDWWHRIDLGGGVVTPGRCPHGLTEDELTKRWGLPADMSGKVVLDLGCRDGLFSAACLRRGAESVLGIDIVERPTFRLVAAALNLDMAFERGDAQECIDPFGPLADVVLCFGVLYHVERPMEVIRNAIATAKDLVIIETAVADHVTGLVTMPDKCWLLARGNEGDPTNIWYPTSGAVLDAMRTFGCVTAEKIYTLPGGSRGTFVGRKATE